MKQTFYDIGMAAIFHFYSATLTLNEASGHYMEFFAGYGTRLSFTI